MVRKPDDRSEARRAILRKWMQDQERGPSWVARHLGYSREYIANVLRGQYPFTDKLTSICIDRLGLDFGYVGPEEETEPEPAAVVLGGA
jgi:hypothetical protein